MTNQFPPDVQRERNRDVIATLRANGGEVVGRGPLLILHTRGPKSGQEYTTPLMYLRDGDRMMIFASFAGAERNPHWFDHLMASPDTEVEGGGETVRVHAEEVVGEERNRIYALQATAYPQFAEYEQRTTRTIPVIALTRR